MTLSVRYDLTDADGLEITEYLSNLGWTKITTNVDENVNPPVVFIEAEGSRNLDADLDSFLPTKARGEYLPAVPQQVKDALARLKVTAQTNATVRDMLILLRYVNNRIE